jgi:hypothetical protein
MLIAPVNVADLASAGSSGDQHLHGVGQFPSRGWPSRCQLQVGFINDADPLLLCIPLLRSVTDDTR